MAQFTVANWETIEKLIAFRSKKVNDAVDLIEADTPNVKTALDGITDDTGIAAAMRAEVETADDALAGLAQPTGNWFAKLVASLWQNAAVAPDDDQADYTFDSWYTAVKASLTNPILTNEIVILLRRAFGTAAVSAANASAPSATSYGTTTVTGATTCTNVLVSAPVDTTLYKGGLLESIVTNQFGSETTFTLTGEDSAGNPWGGTCVVDNGAAIGETFEVVPSVAKTYAVKLTDVTVTGGTNGDAVIWRVKTPRVIEP